MCLNVTNDFILSFSSPITQFPNLEKESQSSIIFATEQPIAIEIRKIESKIAIQ